MKKKTFVLIAAAALLALAGASTWEGAASVSTGSDFPESGYFIATNSYPRNTVVDVTNLENSKTVRVVVASGLDNPGLLAVLSRDAADSIGLSPRSIGRIRMNQPEDPVAYSMFSGGTAGTGDPDHDPAAMVASAGLNPDLFTPESLNIMYSDASGAIASVESVLASTETVEAAPAPETDPAPETPADPFRADPASTEPAAVEAAPASEIPADPFRADTASAEPAVIEAAPVPEMPADPFRADTASTEPAVVEAAPVPETDPAPLAASKPDPALYANPGDYEITLVPAGELAPSEAAPIIESGNLVGPIQPSEPVIDPASVITSIPQNRPAEGPVVVSELLPPQPSVSTPAPVIPSIFTAPLIGNLERGKYYIQLAAFSKAESVESELVRLGKTYPLAVQDGGTPGKPVYRILIGPVNLGESGALLQRFRGTYKDAFVRLGN